MDIGLGGRGRGGKRSVGPSIGYVRFINKILASVMGETRSREGLGAFRLLFLLLLAQRGGKARMVTR